MYSGLKDRELLFASGKVTDALFDARDDRDIAAGIAKRLGFDYGEINPFPDERGAVFAAPLKACMVTLIGR